MCWIFRIFILALKTFFSFHFKSSFLLPLDANLSGISKNQNESLVDIFAFLRSFVLSTFSVYYLLLFTFFHRLRTLLYMNGLWPIFFLHSGTVCSCQKILFRLIFRENRSILLLFVSGLKSINFYRRSRFTCKWTCFFFFGLNFSVFSMIAHSRKSIIFKYLLLNWFVYIDLRWCWRSGWDFLLLWVFCSMYDTLYIKKMKKGYKWVIIKRRTRITRTCHFR